MIGLISPQSLVFPASAEFAATLASADAAFARLGGDFFRSQGWKAEISPKDGFIRAHVPLDLEEDPHGFVRTLGNLQSVLKDKARLVYVERREPELIAHLGFPFPSALVGLLHSLYGAQAMAPTFLSREVPRDEINLMYDRNEQPVGIFDHPMFLSDVGRFVHGFIFMYHDLYHLAFGSALERPLRKMWSVLYDRVNALPDAIRSLPVSQRLLDMLTDNDVDARFAESEEFLAFVPFRGIMDRFQEANRMHDAEESLAIYRECETFLNEFLALLGRGDDPAFLHADFMMKNLREMHTIASYQVSIRDTLAGLF